MNLGKAFVNDIRELIRSARTSIARGVDLVQVHTNLEIGRRIVEQEQKGKDRAAYGKEVIKALSVRLAAEFGMGFSRRNLELMRRFYLMHANRRTGIAQTASALSIESTIAQTVSAQSKLAQTPSRQLGRRSQSSDRPFTLSWSHYVLLLGIKNADERSLYEIESASQSWTVRALKRQFDSSLYERLALSRDKKGIRKLAHEGQTIAKPEDLLKEPLVLEFLGLDEKHQYLPRTRTFTQANTACICPAKRSCARNSWNGANKLATRGVTEAAALPRYRSIAELCPGKIVAAGSSACFAKFTAMQASPKPVAISFSLPG
jgi:hypothetical protein